MPTSKFNPEIFPSNGRSKEEHRRAITSTIIVTVIVVIIGTVFWLQNQPNKDIPVAETPPQNQIRGPVILTPEQVQTKIAQIKYAQTGQIKLTKAQSTLKAQQIKALTQINKWKNKS